MEDIREKVCKVCYLFTGSDVFEKCCEATIVEMEGCLIFKAIRTLQSSQECPKEKCGKYGKYDMMDGVAIPRCIGDCKRYVQSDNFEPVSPVNLESKKEE